MNKIYTSKELCEQLGITRTTLWLWHKTGKIKFERIGQKLLVPMSEVEKFGLINSKQGGANETQKS